MMRSVQGAMPSVQDDDAVGAKRLTRVVRRCAGRRRGRGPRRLQNSGSADCWPA